MERKHAPKTKYVPIRSRFIAAIQAFFTGSFETDWEKKTRMLWKEW
jgi:hypothetical protein